MKYDVAVIGGGVVGSAIFSKLVRLGVSSVLLEKENDVGFGASKANTAIIHSGLDCKPGTLKARLNVRGNFLYEKLSKELNFKYVKNGHLVVGNDLQKLEELKKRGETNGVKGLKIINKAELLKLEPNINPEINYALFEPSGGIVSSYEIAIAFAEDGILNGGDCMLMFDTKKVVEDESGFKLFDANNRIVEANIVVVACGEGYNKMAEILNIEKSENIMRRGEYYLLDVDNTGFVNRTIFPLPTEHSKGVLVTPTVNKNILLGPTSIVSDNSTRTTADGLKYVRENVASIFPNINLKNNIRVFAGVRNIVGDDFIIKRSDINPNCIIVDGICSPGLSSAPAIAEMVAEILGLDINKERKKLKKRKDYGWFKDLSESEKNKVIKRNPDFGQIVCRCENISLGEIKEACTGVLPALSVDAVKRRTRAGMGRCQGGFCIFGVMSELAKTNNLAFEDINKDGVGGNIICSDIEPNRLLRKKKRNLK